MIELKENTISFCVIIVFVEPAFDSIIVDVIIFNYEVCGLGSAEESVPAIVKNTTPDNNMLALLYINGSCVIHIISRAGSARRRALL